MLCKARDRWTVLPGVDGRGDKGSRSSGRQRGGLSPNADSSPPLEEQRRIVAKVDELIAVCDRLEA